MQIHGIIQFGFKDKLTQVRKEKDLNQKISVIQDVCYL